MVKHGDVNSFPKHVCSSSLDSPVYEVETLCLVHIDMSDSKLSVGTCSSVG